MTAYLHFILEKDRDVFPVKLVQQRIGVDVDFLERDAEAAQALCHLLAEMAVRPPV
jgi:hypothetical protein